MIWVEASLRAIVEAEYSLRACCTRWIGEALVNSTFRNGLRRAERRAWVAARRIERSGTAADNPQGGPEGWDWLQRGALESEKGLGVVLCKVAVGGFIA